MKSLEKQSREELAESTNLLAHAKWDEGDLRSAFRLFRKAASLGAYAAEHTVGYMYDTGIGVRRNRSAAMRWYRRSFRKGLSISATNIGTVYRDEGKTSLALRWFRKAVDLGDISPNLEIAKLLFSRLSDPETAQRHLRLVLKAKGGGDVTIHDQEQAAALLKKIRSQSDRKRSVPRRPPNAQTRPPQRTRS